MLKTVLGLIALDQHDFWLDLKVSHPLLQALNMYMLEQSQSSVHGQMVKTSAQDPLQGHG